MLFWLCVVPYIAEGPFWYQLRSAIDKQQSYWWSTLLYVQNFYPTQLSNSVSLLLLLLLLTTTTTATATTTTTMYFQFLFNQPTFQVRPGPQGRTFAVAAAGLEGFYTMPVNARSSGNMEHRVERLIQHSPAKTLFPDLDHDLESDLEHDPDQHRNLIDFSLLDHDPDLNRSLDPRRYPDCHQNIITWSLGHPIPLQKNFIKTRSELRNPADKQTD